MPSPASSTTSATAIRPVWLPSGRSASSRAGTRCSIRPARARCISLLLTLLGPGETIAITGEAYYGTPTLIRTLERWGIRMVEFDQTGPPPDGADLVWIEAPAEPAALDAGLRGGRGPSGASRRATRPQRRRSTCARSSEAPTSSLHSATKFLGGHHDVLLGAVVAKGREDYERLLEFRSRSGIVAAPDPAWLLSRSLKTLPLRMERHTANATELARRLEAHPGVERVRYPGFGGLMSFDVAGGAQAARRVETSTRLIKNATSLGGADSVLETRARWEGDRVPENLVRLSVGLEDVDAIWADLEQALEERSE